MAEVVTTYRRSLEEWGRTRYRRGRDEGIRQGRDEGQAVMLVQLVREKFGPEAAEELASLLGRDSGSARLTVAASALLKSATAEEFLAWLQSSFSD